jgi:hypothetical protein
MFSALFLYRGPELWECDSTMAASGEVIHVATPYHWSADATTVSAHLRRLNPKAKITVKPADCYPATPRK